MLGGIEQSEEFPLLGVIGSRRIAGGGTDATVLLPDEFLLGEVLHPAEPPEITRLLVKPLRRGFREAVPDRFHQQGGVVVMILLKGISILAHPGACRDGEAPDGVDPA